MVQSTGSCNGRAKAQAVATGALSAAERSHPTSEVRGRSWEDPMPKGLRPRGVTPHPRSGAVAESTRLRRHRTGREELPRVRGQAGQARGDTQCPRSGAATRGVTPRPRSGAAMRGVSYPASEVRGRGREEIPHAPSPRPGVAGGRSYPTHPRPRLRAAAGRINPMFKEQWRRRCRRA